MVGALLPTSDVAPRWENADGPALDNYLKGTNYALDTDIQNIDQDPDAATKAVHELVSEGCKVIVLAATTPQVDQAITRAARAAAIPTIGYDTGSGSSADYLITPDYHSIGQLQARGIIRGVRDTPDAGIVELESAPDATTLTALDQGQRDVLQPRFDAGSYTLISTRTVHNPDEVGAVLDQLIRTHPGRLNGVLASTDAIAEATNSALRAHGLIGSVTVTGYGASTPALQAILRGEQFMTVDVSPDAEAQLTARLAAALATNDHPTLGLLVPPGGPHALHVPAHSVTLDDITEVFTNSLANADDVCDSQLELRCNQLDIP